MGVTVAGGNTRTIVAGFSPHAITRPYSSPAMLLAKRMDRKGGPRRARRRPSSSKPMSRRHSSRRWQAPVRKYTRFHRAVRNSPNAKGLKPCALGVYAVHGSLDTTRPSQPDDRSTVSSCPTPRVGVARTQLELPFWPRNAARDAPAGPAPMIKMSVSISAAMFEKTRVETIPSHVQVDANFGHQRRPYQIVKLLSLC
jgi:hypothetical protein